MRQTFKAHFGDGQHFWSLFLSFWKKICYYHGKIIYHDNALALEALKIKIVV